MRFVDQATYEYWSLATVLSGARRCPFYARSSDGLNWNHSTWREGMYGPAHHVNARFKSDFKLVSPDYAPSAAIENLY